MHELHVVLGVNGVCCLSISSPFFPTTDIATTCTHCKLSDPYILLVASDSSRMITGRCTPTSSALAVCVIIFFYGLFKVSSEHSDSFPKLRNSLPWLHVPHTNGRVFKNTGPISYDLNTPPSIGCEAVVSDLQLRLVEAYSQLLMGIRHVNIWGYLATENKGDAAIWVGQQIMLAQLGITSYQNCR
jgi:hypothetical protein